MNGATMLAAAAARRERRVMLAACLLFAGLAAGLWLGGASARIPDLGLIQLAILALPTFWLWLGWFPRLLVLHAHAQALRVPRMAAYAGATLLAAAGVTIMLPAIVLSFGGTPMWVSAGVLACIAGAALLMAVLPRGMSGLVGFVPLAFAAIGDHLDGMLDWPRALPLLACLLALLVAWRWLRIQRRPGDWSEPGWQQPLVFAMARSGGLFGRGDLLDTRAQTASLPRWLRLVDDLGSLRPGQSRTLRVLLGGIFAPIGWRQRLVLGALYLGVLALVWRQSVSDGDSPWQMLMFAGLVSGGILLLGPFALRVQALQQEHGGEMAELALLPGWGDARQARARLLRTIARVYANWCLAMAVVMAWGAAMTGQPAVVALALLSTAALAVLGAAMWLRPLAGQPWNLDAWTAAPVLLLGPPLLGATVVAFDGALLVEPMLAAWAVLLACGALLAVRAWRRFESRAQPFLMY